MTTFDDAFAFTMRYEVGPKFDDIDPDVIAGRIDTKEQRRRVGYTNDPVDRGGETKFGVAKRANPNVDIEHLTLNDAKTLYWNQYWIPSRAGELPGKWAVAHFDAAVNHGVHRAIVLLQRAVGANDDGVFGTGTLSKVLLAHGTISGSDLVAPRRKFFMGIVANAPSQKRFLSGWLARCDAVEKELA